MRSFLFFLALAQIAKEARGVARAAEQERSTEIRERARDLRVTPTEGVRASLFRRKEQPRVV
jgi:hypothetical protein